MFRIFLFLLGFAMLSQTAEAQRAGVGAWENPNYTILKWIEQQSGVSWYYNWRSDQIASRQPQRRLAEFVPMIHSAKNINDRIQSSQNPQALLGFNEPDGNGGDHQAGMTVEQAVALWPQLEARGLRLGSPATTREGTLGHHSWQRRFMNEVARRGLRVDFMAVHYYSTTGDVAEFRNWLIQVHREYKRPIWVTEFALIDWSRPGRASYAANADFAKSAIEMMQDLSFVERHAWFAANPYPWPGGAPSINLVDNQLRETPVGRAFRQAVAGEGTGRLAALGVENVAPESVNTRPNSRVNRSGAGER